MNSDQCLGTEGMLLTSKKGGTHVDKKEKEYVRLNVEDLDERSHSCEENNVYLRSIQNRIWVMGSLTWMLGPPFLAISYVASSCDVGLRTAYYSIPLGAIAVKSYIEHDTVHMMKAFKSNIVAGSGKSAWERWEHTASLMDNRYVLLLLGASAAMDFFTDHSQASQVFICEYRSNTTFHEQYVRSYSGALRAARPVVQKIGVSSLFMLMLLCIYFIQGAHGCIMSSEVSFHLQRNSGRVMVSNRIKRKFVATDQIAAIAKLAQLAEWACASSLAMLLKKFSDKEEVYMDVREDAIAHAENIVWQSVLRVVATENAPSLSLTSTFFCLAFEAMTPLARAKNIFCFLLSAAAALNKAKAAWSLNAKGKAASFGIFALVLASAIKMAFAFVCPSHIFSYFTVSCATNV